MRTSQSGVDLIKHFETCKLIAYADPATGGDPWTCGWGATGPDIRRGTIWTQQQADRRLEDDLLRFERDVTSLCKRTPTQGQFDAMVSFAYNVGPDIDSDDIAEGLGDSTLLKKFNAGDIQAAADQFPKWNKAAGKVLNGLTKRRNAERALFLGKDWRAALSA